MSEPRKHALAAIALFLGVGYCMFLPDLINQASESGPIIPALKTLGLFAFWRFAYLNMRR